MSYTEIRGASYLSKFELYGLSIARLTAKLSYCKRKKVGASLFKGNRLLATGYNGTPAGTCNNCEDSEGITKDIVSHAEENLLGLCLREGINTQGCSLFITLSPCIHCAKLIVQSGISKVYFANVYKDTSGITFLTDLGVECIHLHIPEDFDLASISPSV